MADTKKYAELSDKIVDLVGGKDNISFYALIVMTGMHVGLIPIAVTNISKLGYEPNMIASTISNLNQGVACLAVAAKTKDRELRTTALSCGIAGVFGGVTEPAMFGVTLPLKMPLYGAITGGLVAGALAGLMHVYAYAFGSSAFPFAVFCYMDAEGNGIVTCLIALLIGAAVTFGTTWVLYKDAAQQ